MEEFKYLELLSRNFKNIGSTITEIINLQAILNLPKSTEHFLSDVHGEYEAFSHVLKNGSGTIKQNIRELFKDSLTEKELKELATIIYYPKEKLNIMENSTINLEKWVKTIINRLIMVCKDVSSKYSRSKVRKAMPKDFEYILQELIYENPENSDKMEYIDSIIDTIISIKRYKEFVIAISKLIKKLTIDHLHIVGDIYDRGPSPHLIMDTLDRYHNVDVQWGNHDMLWMGAGIGNKACIANVIRISARYNHNDILEEGYGINLLPLATYAMKYYGNDPCTKFRAKRGIDSDLIAQIHKAITIIQFKVEGIFSQRNPEFGMRDREILNDINYEKGTIIINGVEYELNDKNFPTVDRNDPLKLTDEEAEILEKLKFSFLNSEKLKRHLNILFSKGSMYLSYNSNLLYHGCLPFNEDGSFAEIVIDGVGYKGKALMDKCENIVRQAFFNIEENEKDKRNRDFLWYLWCGKYSPLFGKDVMRTFERYFIDDKITHKEIKNDYYKYIYTEEACDMVFKEFNMNPSISHIINGHIPVKVKNGETPIKSNGKLIVIDGGFARAYQNTTGIAGYTLIFDSYGLKLASHAPFTSREDAINNSDDILSREIVVNKHRTRMRVKDTDIGRELQKQINDLKKLLIAYRKGIIKPKEILNNKE